MCQHLSQTPFETRTAVFLIPQREHGVLIWRKVAVTLLGQGSPRWSRGQITCPWYNILTAATELVYWASVLPRHRIPWSRWNTTVGHRVACRLPVIFILQSKDGRLLYITTMWTLLFWHKLVAKMNSVVIVEVPTTLMRKTTPGGNKNKNKS